MNVTVAIPSIPPRAAYLRKAIDSVLWQSRPAAGFSIAIDKHHEGGPITRQRALDGVQTDWVAFLDDDDWFFPEHLQVLTTAAEQTGADYVYSYYQVYMYNEDGVLVESDFDPLGHLGKTFDPADPIQTTITTLVRTELAKEIGFYSPPEGAEINGQTYGEDYQFTVGCANAGAKILHVPQRTWAWSHHGRNTSGLNTRW